MLAFWSGDHGDEADIRGAAGYYYMYFRVSNLVNNCLQSFQRCDYRDPLGDFGTGVCNSYQGVRSMNLGSAKKAVGFSLLCPLSC